MWAISNYYNYKNFITIEVLVGAIQKNHAAHSTPTSSKIRNWELDNLNHNQLVTDLLSPWPHDYQI